MPYRSSGVGYRPTDTSYQAAVQVEPKAPTIRDKVIAYMGRIGQPVTADEIAAGIFVDFMSVRPRMTELKETGKIVDSGTRKIGPRGKLMIAWKLA